MSYENFSDFAGKARLVRGDAPILDVPRTIEREAAELYRAHGAVDYATYRAADLTAKYRCATFTMR